LQYSDQAAKQLLYTHTNYAKAQQHNGNQYFTTAKYSDSSSEYTTSAEHSSIFDSDISSSEAEEPVVLTQEIPKEINFTSKSTSKAACGRM